MLFSSRRLSIAHGISASALATAIIIASPADAQTASGIRGRVEGATAGAVVTATDTFTGQKLTGRINADGNYNLVGLRPSTYRIEVEGKTPQQVTVPVGQTAIVDFTNAPAASAPPAAGEAPAAGGEAPAAGNDIVVTGRRQLETRTATTSTNVSQAQIENLPQNDRNFLNFAALAPGVSVSPSSGSRQVQAGAVSADNINVFIDGLSLKNPVNHGGVAGQNFSLGNPFPQLAVQEFKVDTQNFKAEYEQAGSAIITAVTKTGGDEYHGDLFGEWQPKAFIGQKYFDRPGKANNLDGSKKKADYDRKQYGGDFGGPIIKDVLHFYGAFEATDQKLASNAVNLDTTIDDQGRPGVSQAIASQYNGSYPQSFKQRLYFGKLTLFATPEDTINLSSFLRREQNLSDYGGQDVPSHGHILNSRVDLYQLEWNHRGEDWLNEATVAYNYITNGTPRVSDGPEIILTRGTDTGSKLAGLGANGFVQDDRQKTWTVKDNLTFFKGDHVMKGGVRLTFNEYSRLEDSQSNGTYYFEASSFTDFANSTPYAARISTIPVQAAQAKNNQIGLFVQDDWSPDEHWTVNAGIRWDYETNSKNEDFVTPQKVVDALRSYQGWQAAGINPDDYISTGKNRKPYWKAFQPRVGVSYDLNGDRDTIFFVGAGRYYDRPLFITAGIETLKAYYQSTSQITATPGTPVPKDVDALRAAAIAQNLGGDVWLLNNDTKLPYSDQFNFGFRKRLGSIQTSVTFSHIRSHNIFQYVRGNRYSNGWYTRTLEGSDLNGDGAFQDNEVTGCHDGGVQWIQDTYSQVDFTNCAARNGNLSGYTGKLNIGRNDGKAVYNAVYFTAEKPYTDAAGWGFTTTLTVQRARTNDGQGLGSDEFYNGPDQRVYGWNYIPNVEKFRFVGTGIAKGPFDTKLSGTLTLGSGPSFGQVLNPPNPPENATTYGNFAGVYFPHETFGYSNLDLRISKNFHLPWNHDFEVSFAAFNVFDTVNRTYSAWGAGSGYNPTFQENDTVGNARSFQVGAKYKF